MTILFGVDRYKQLIYRVVNTIDLHHHGLFMADRLQIFCFLLKRYYCAPNQLFLHQSYKISTFGMNGAWHCLPWLCINIHTFTLQDAEHQPVYWKSRNSKPVRRYEETKLTPPTSPERPESSQSQYKTISDKKTVAKRLLKRNTAERMLNFSLI